MMFRRSMSRGLPLSPLFKSFSTVPKTTPVFSIEEKSIEDVDKRIYKAKHAFLKSCYQNIDFKIKSDLSCAEAMQILTANNIGALAVTEDDKVVGILSERDLLNKISFLKKDQDTPVKNICTYGADNLVTVAANDSVDTCMQALLNRDIRHLLITQDSSEEIVGMISIKDVVKCVVDKHVAVIDNIERVMMEQDMMRYQT